MHKSKESDQRTTGVKGLWSTMVYFGGKLCLQQKFYILMKQALA